MKTIKLKWLLAGFFMYAFSGVTAQNNALNFDGNNDFIGVPGITNPSGSFTAEAWARMETYGMRTVLSKIQSGYYGFTISYDAPNNRMGADIGTGSSWPNVLSLLPWNLNQWYHVAMVYDAASDTMYFYQDGILQGAVYVVPAHSTTSFKIGNDDWSELWDGDIDEVRFWNIARTQAEIQSTMNMELTGAEPGLTNYYQFNQGTPGGNNTGVGSLLDSKGGANGTFVNFALTGSTSNFVGSIALGLDQLQAGNISIYPNPVSDELRIENTGNPGTISFDIFNSEGQVVIRGNLIDKTIVSTKDFAPGIYFLKLQSGDTFVSKVIVKN